MIATVSVVIPCFNGANFIRETLESALAQTHPPLEVIVVDDGSTDDSAAIAESFGPPVRVIQNPSRSGAGAARKHGILNSKGAYIAFTDADDPCPPRKIEFLLAGLRSHPNAIASYGYTEPYPPNSSAPADPSETRANLKTQLITDAFEKMATCPIPLAGAMNFMSNRKALIDAASYSSFFRAANDYDLQLRLAKVGPFSLVQVTTGLYRKKVFGSISNTYGKHRQRSLAMLALSRCVDDTKVSASRRVLVLKKLQEDMAWAMSGAIHARSFWHSIRLAKLSLKLRCSIQALRGVKWSFERHSNKQPSDQVSPPA